MEGILLAWALPFAGALALNLFCTARSAAAGRMALAFVATSFAAVLSATPSLLHHPATYTIEWAPSLGLSFSVAVDGLSLLFSLLITGVGVAVFGFAASYLGPEENRRRFFSYLLLFMGAMLGVVLSANLIGLFVFWEMTSFSSFLLIGFWHTRDASRRGAMKALVVTASGGLAMLVGFIMLGQTLGSYEIAAILEKRDLLLESPWAIPLTLLIIAGIITKSAQVPFHLWLPTAMEAPTPVSAFLHAATMVKAGLYLTARLGPLLAGVSLWTPTLTALGLATMVWCGLLALRQRDLKALLAFSTVSQLGLILSLLADPSASGSGAGLLHLVNHGLFKGALFLLVGIIEHQAHTRDVLALGPLGRRMPLTATVLVLAALAMAGVPPLGGFVSKELFLEHMLSLSPMAAAIAVGGSVLTAAYCFGLILAVLNGHQRAVPTTHQPHDPGWKLLWAPAVLAMGALVAGLAPQATLGPLVEAATQAAIGTGAEHPHLHLALWHGFTPTLGVSVGVLTTGLLVCLLWWKPRLPDTPRLWADRAYETVLEKLESWSRALTASYMSGLVWRYNLTILLVAVGGVAYVVTTMGLPSLQPWPSRAPQTFEYLVAAVTAGAAIGAASAHTRLAAILALGASGYSLALLFALLGAPDLALTQIMVETIAVALFLAVFVYLPQYPPPASRGWRPAHLGVAAVVGCGIPGLLAVFGGPRTLPSISEYFVSHSVEEAGGHNIVNVILVDFRGLDTLGEITVVAVAALACYSLIRLRSETENPS